MKKRKGEQYKVALRAIKTLPYFTMLNLKNITNSEGYLRIILSRLKKRGEVVALKRGIYVSPEYLNIVKSKNFIDAYRELVANSIYQPSYLSCEYVLQKYGIMSEAVMTLTSVSTKKTNKFINELGAFRYYSIREKLFTGFSVKQKGDFMIAEASLGKALFDFLYFRKNILNSLSEVEELRLNLENLKKRDFREFKKYIKLEGSKKMQRINKYLMEIYE